jgi:hypothetical protein
MPHRTRSPSSADHVLSEREQPIGSRRSSKSRTGWRVAFALIHSEGNPVANPWGGEIRFDDESRAAGH